MPGFNSAGNGDLTSGLFLTETDILDDLVGDSLFLWGYNGSGQLGNNTSGAVTNSSFPIQTVAGGTNWKLVHGSTYNDQVTAAIKTDGTLWMWGTNFYGQLGDSTTVDKSSPITLSGTNWRQVAPGQYHVMAVKTDGTLWGWGTNAYGQLGTGNVTSRSSPVQDVTLATTWKQVDTSDRISAAIKTDGTLWLWGRNNFGRLGEGSNNPTLVPRSSPVQTIAGGTNWKQVSCGLNFVTATKTDGTLWSWGRNEFGQLGEGSNNPTLADRSSPVQTIAGGTNWKQVAAGAQQSAAIKTDGTLWTWGYNDNGMLGEGSNNVALAPRSSPVQTIAGGTNWKQVSCGDQHMAAIKTDGTLWLWGRGAEGQLGDSTTVAKSSPVQTVTGGTNWKQVSCGSNFTAAITTGQVT